MPFLFADQCTVNLNKSLNNQKIIDSSFDFWITQQIEIALLWFVADIFGG